MEVVKGSLISFFKNFDVFGENHTFRINGQKTYSSPVGGCLCFVFIFYAAYYIVYSFLDFVNGINKTKEFDIKNSLEPHVSMKDHDYFSIAFCIRNDELEIDSYLTNSLKMKMVYHQSKLNNDTKKLTVTEDELPLESCKAHVLATPDKNGNERDYWNLMHYFDMTTCKCLSFGSQNRNLNLSSKFERAEKNSFTFKLKVDENAIDNDLNDYLTKSNRKLHIYFPEYSADMYNDTDPLHIKVHTESYIINPTKTKVSDILFGLLSFTDYYSYTYTGLFSFKNRLAFNSKNDYELNNLQDFNLMKIDFSLSGLSTTYQRNYLILEDYFGNVLSYLWNWMVLIYSISYVYNSFGANRSIAQKFFIHNDSIKQNLRKEFKNENGENLRKIFKSPSRNKSSEVIENDQSAQMGNLINDNSNRSSNIDNQSKLEVLMDRTNKRSIDLVDIELESKRVPPVNKGESSINSNEVQPPSNIQANASNVNPYLKYKKNYYNISFFTYLSQAICFCRQKNKDYKLYKACEAYYNYYMDVNYYLGMTFEFEMTKRMTIPKENREHLSRINPILKKGYADTYNGKLRKMYDKNVLQSDVDKKVKGIRMVKASNNESELKMIMNHI